MNKGRDRTKSSRTDGSWENKRKDSNTASSVHRRQKEPEQAARAILRNQGAGKLTTKGGVGKIRPKKSIIPGNYLNPLRDTEH